MIHIRRYANVVVPDDILAYAETVKRDSYATGVPAKFHIRRIPDDHPFVDVVARAVGREADRDRFDLVYFSCCRGAETHVDHLPHFEPFTYLIPVITPSGTNTFQVGDDYLFGRLCRGITLGFDHTVPHSLTLVDTESGCVMVMAAVRRT